MNLVKGLRSVELLHRVLQAGEEASLDVEDPGLFGLAGTQVLHQTVLEREEQRVAFQGGRQLGRAAGRRPQRRVLRV